MTELITVIGLIASAVGIYEFVIKRAKKTDKKLIAEAVAEAKKADAQLIATAIQEFERRRAQADLADPGISLDGAEKDFTAAVKALLAQGAAGREAVERFNATGDQEAARAVLLKLARAEEEAGQVANRQAAERYRQLGALAFLDDTEAALRFYAKATDLDPDDAEGWNQLGHLQHRTGDLDAAQKSYERVLALGNSVADQATVAAAYVNLGILYQTRGELREAEAMYKKALALDEALGRKEGMANQYGNLGNLFKTRGDLGEAEAMHKKALALDEALGRKEGMASHYGNLGIVYKTRRDFGEAEAMYKKALALNEALGRKEGMASNYGNLGNLYKMRGDLGEACSHWRTARDLFRAVGMKPEIEKLERQMREAGCKD